MARGGSREALAFSMPFGPATSIGVEGEMTRVSIASLLEGAGTPVVAGPDDTVADHVGVSQHGMIMDLYSSGSLSAMTLDFGLAAPPGPATVAGAVQHVFDAGSAGDVHLPRAELLQGADDSSGTSLGFAGEQHIPEAPHGPVADQSILGNAEVALGRPAADHFSALDSFELGHREIVFLCGDQLTRQIDVQHFIA